MDSYQFSEIQNGSALAFSPGSTFIATAIGDQVIVRSTATLSGVRLWVCTTTTQRDEGIIVDHLQWSPSGSRLLAFSSRHASLWVFDITTDDITCHITGGIHQALWGDEDLLAWSDTGLAIHDLKTGHNRFIQCTRDLLAWSPDRQYLALVERHHGKDFIGIYDRQSLIRHFPIETTETSGISWSPCGRFLALWDWRITYSVMFYSPVGSRLGQITVSPIDATTSELGLGIFSLAWSPNGRHLAIGDHEGVVRVIESETWSPIAALRGWEGQVWKEPVKEGRHEGITQFCIGSSLPSRSRVERLGFSPDGALLFFTHEMALHVYSFLPDPGSSVPEITHKSTIHFSNAIQAANCCPTINRIGIATRTRTVYMWDLYGVEGVGVPNGPEFTVVNVEWAPDGKSASLSSRSSFCIVYENQEGTCEVEDILWEEVNDS